ncbi:MAG TPA: SDR family oxidoreductase [Actinomycetales bacterium]|nr:SDR family oxidoreductase [Actinomycetales bacterium]
MTPQTDPRPVALVTGGSQGLGLVLVRALAARGWHVITDARDAVRLDGAVGDLENVTPVGGDVADPRHRAALAAAVDSLGRLDLLVNNASTLGASPLPHLSDHAVDALEHVYAVNTIAPLALLQLVLPALRRSGGRVVNVSSDAAVEAYEGWGAYGSAKAALDHATAVLAVENPDLRVYAIDPGDMRTEMHQRAFPGDDISDRPLPDDVLVPFLRLVDGDEPSGRYRAAELAPVAAR